MDGIEWLDSVPRRVSLFQQRALFLKSKYLAYNELFVPKVDRLNCIFQVKKIGISINLIKINGGQLLEHCNTVVFQLLTTHLSIT